MLLVKPPSEHLVVPPLGLGYLARGLKKHGISSRIIHCSKDSLTATDVANLIREEGIDIVGVTSCSNDHPWIVEFATELESLPDVCFVVGGPHATGLASQFLEAVPRINFAMRSEADISFPQLVSAVRNGSLSDSDLGEIRNLIWRDSSGRITENPVERPADLDALGYPDWDQMPPGLYAKYAPHGGFGKATPVTQILTTRGCPYGCNYCAAGLMNGRKIRRKSPRAVVEEIQYLARTHGVREFHIEDDNFTFYRDHVMGVCAEIRRSGVTAYFTVPNGVRLDRLDDEILLELKATGFYSITLGIESGNAETLKRMQKALDLGQVEESIARIRKYGFRINAYFIIGYPGETAREIVETIEFARSLDLDRAYFTTYIPLPGTGDFAMLREQGRLDVENLPWSSFYTMGRTDPPFVPEGMTGRELQDLSHLAYRRFYLRPGIVMKLLKDIRIRSPRQFLEVAWNLARLNLSYFI